MSPRIWFIAAVVVCDAASCLTSIPAHAITYDLVPVGNAGNAADTTTYGAVAYDYRIGKNGVTIGQYTSFLNAVAATDTYSLYNASMAADLNVAGIARSGSSGSYTYSVIDNYGNSGNRPITYVSWFDAARFANWMHNGQGSGSTETGAYTLVGGQTSGTAPARNPGAQFFVPTESEWYKAAYYSPLLNSGSGGYYTYATQSDSVPGNIIGSGSNQANYYHGAGYAVTQLSSFDAGQNYLTDVGAFSSSASFYGTFDQSGNVLQWNDLTGAADVSRGLRGGNWYAVSAVDLSSSNRLTVIASNETEFVGFRLASPIAPVPEPSTSCMALAGLACGGLSMLLRRRKSA